MANAKNARPDFPTVIVTPVFRLSYPHVFQSSYNQLAKRDEYSIQMLFDKKEKAALAPMIKLVQDIIVWKGWASVQDVRKPWIDGDTKTDEAGVLWKDKNPASAGMIILKSWSKASPGVVDCTGKHPITQQDEIYGGCYCRAQLNAYAYDQAGNKGIGFGLVHVQKIKDGESFGTRGKAEDAFSPVDNPDAAGAASDSSMFS